ncbi:Ocs element-binding factor 1 [Platanthera guangdongensis]|uniref:Ocs element-binding factor 1 n=1 Tax=Platanthera guangdongensis TaxID=2320717 RepID=A0ABR2MSI6_9ASPA
MSAGEIEERKRKRMMSNRESAKRSRMKKQQHLDELVNEMARFSEENDLILRHVNLITAKYLRLDTENEVMRTQVMELAGRLKFLRSILRLVEEESGMSLDIPEIPGPLLKQWTFPCSAQPILMSSSMFHC